MKTLGEVSRVLAERASTRRYSKMQLAADAGVTYRTLSHMLGGEQDFKVSTLMAVADRLGLELVLMPKEARAMFPSSENARSTSEQRQLQVQDAPLKAPPLGSDSGKDHPSQILSKVQARLARARKRSG